MKWIYVCVVLALAFELGCSTPQKSRPVEIVSMSDDEVHQLVSKTVPIGTSSADADSAMSKLGFRCSRTEDGVSKEAGNEIVDELRCRRKDTDGLVDVVTVVSLAITNEAVSEIDVSRLYTGP